MDSINKIPAELKALKHWVLYKLEFRNDEEKPSKVPYQINGSKAATNPSSWESYQCVLETLQKASEAYNGLGFVFAEDDPYTGIDLDNCIINGQLTDEAQRIVDHFCSYTEISQSGTGLQIIVKAKLFGTGKKVNENEIYDRGHYFVVTGNHIPSTPTSIEDRQSEVTEFYPSLTIRAKPLDTEIVRTSTLLVEDQEIITIASQAMNKISNFKKGSVLQPIHSQDEQLEELDFLHTDNEWNGVLGEAAYHGLVGDVIRQIEPHSEADNTALLLTFLVLFGNLVGIEPHFKVSSEVHRMKLFIVLVGATFKGRKGTSFPPVYNLMLEVDADLKQRKKSGLSSGEGVIHSVRNPTIVREPMFEGQGKSKKPTGKFNEVVEDPGVPDKRMLFVESEFSRVLNALKQDSNTLSAVIRDAWDGNGDLGIVTRNKPISATDTHISIIGHITPEELRDKTRNKSEIYNGFVNRFLWLYVQQSKSLPNGGNLHKEDLGPIVSRIREAVEYAQYGIPRNDKNEPLPMERDEAADQFWNSIYQPLQRDVPGIIGAASSRAIPYIMRLACIYALLDSTYIVRLEHLKAALAIWKFNYKSIQHIFGEQEVIKDPITIKILEALQNQTEDMSFTSISNLLQRHTTGKEIQRVVKKMEENGLITVHLEKGHSGRPRRVIKLNKLDTVEHAN